MKDAQNITQVSLTLLMHKAGIRQTVLTRKDFDAMIKDFPGGSGVLFKVIDDEIHLELMLASEVVQRLKDQSDRDKSKAEMN